MRKRIPLKALDILIIVLALALTLGIAREVYSGSTAASRVVIRSPDKTWIFPLDAEERLIVVGPIGETSVEISKGRAAIVASPCAGQTCAAAGGTTGGMSKSGQWAACLPNRVFLLIEGEEGENAIDAISW